MCTAMNKKNISLSVAPPLMERSYQSISSGILTAHTKAGCHPAAISSGGRAPTAFVRGPGSILGGIFHSSPKILLSLFIM